MNHEAILAVLPDSKDDALSLKEIAQALGLEMNSYVDWIRAERRLEFDSYPAGLGQGAGRGRSSRVSWPCFYHPKVFSLES